MKKTALILIMLACFLFAATPLSAGEVFTDVNTSDWFYSEVSDAYNNGFVSGTSTTKFTPNGTMTRGQFVTILGRMEGINTASYNYSSFSDVNKNAYYSPYITWAYKNNIIAGVGNGKFAPEQAVTREQIARILHGYITTKGYNLPASDKAPAAFRDANKVSSWAKNGMEAMRYYGIIIGDENQKCNPTMVCIRAEGTAMLQRFYELVRQTERGSFWTSKFPVPTDAQITADTNPYNSRSPYIFGWLSIPNGQRFTEYAIDFKADYLPRGTYCCVGQWAMDTTELKKSYTNVHTEYSNVFGYAGFQSTVTPKGKTSILSLWDIYGTNSAGKQVTFRAKRVFPTTADNDNSFGGEGTGAHYIGHFNWEEGHWYRMLLQSYPSSSGTMLVDQFVCDLETGVWYRLACYDTGLKKSCFTGPVAVFLENYIPALAGEVRSLEMKNIRYRDADTGKWTPVKTMYIGPNGGTPTYEGSYAFGSTDDRFWMITSGVGGDWYSNGKGQKAAYYSVTQCESGPAY